MSNSFALVPSGYKSGKVYSFIGGDMTFTRASTATRANRDGLIEYVASGVPRVEKANYMPLEPARTNQFQRSEDFSNAYWSKTNVTIDADAEIAPDGRQTADGIRETTTSGEHRVSRSYSFAGGDTYYTFSVFAKYGGRPLNLFSSTSSRFEVNSTFDLEAGTVSVVTGTASIEAFPSGWYRCSVTGVSASSGTSTVYYRHRNESNNTTYAGDVAKYTLLWGAQLESGNHNSSYIPTFSSTVTRVAETCVGGSGDFNDTEGVLFAEIQAIGDVPDSNAYISLSDNTASNMLLIRYTTDGLLQIHNNGTSTSTRVYGEDFDLTDNLKIAVQYGTQTEDYKVFINGVEKTVFGTFTASAMSGLDTLDLAYPTNTFPFLGKVRQVLVYNQVMTDAQLIELTR